jgi:hypothetical protein
MHLLVAIVLVAFVATYAALQFALHATQSRSEPRLVRTLIPFFDSTLGFLEHKVNYLLHLK